MSINDGIYPIYIQWELNTVPTSHVVVIADLISLVLVDPHHEIQKRPDLLWSVVRGSLTLVLFTYLSWRPESFKIKTAWSDTSMVWTRKPKSLLHPFSAWFLTGDTISTKRAQKAPTFMDQSHPPLEMTYTVYLYNL